MRAHQATYPVVMMCRLLDVSTSGFYAWRNRTVSKRAQHDAMLIEYIRAIHERSRGTYGAPRIHAELREHGISVARKCVARLMREAGLEGVSRRRGPRTTLRDPREAAAPDLVERDFTALAPDALWVADITYVATASGFVYLAVTMDAFSRRIVGWSMAGHLRTELVLSALDMALSQRKADGVIHHSDQSSQYTALAFGERCKEAGVRPSTGSVGDCYDNSMCESFFATLECELLERRRFATKAEARMAGVSGILCTGQEGFESPRLDDDELIDYQRPMAQRPGPPLRQPHRHRIAQLQRRHLVR